MRPNIWTPNHGPWTTTQREKHGEGIDVASFPPVSSFNFGRARRFQDGSDVVDTRLDGMDRKQDRPSLNGGLECLGSTGRDSRAGQCAPEAPRHMPCSLTEARRERPGGHDRTDSWKHQRDRSQQMSGQLAKAGRGTGVLYLGAGRSSDLLRVIRFFIVIAADDRELIRTDARAMQLAGGKSGLRDIGEQGDDEWVHCYKVKGKREKVKGKRASTLQHFKKQPELQGAQ